MCITNRNSTYIAESLVVDGLCTAKGCIFLLLADSEYVDVEIDDGNTVMNFGTIFINYIVDTDVTVTRGRGITFHEFLHSILPDFII